MVKRSEMLIKILQSTNNKDYKPTQDFLFSGHRVYFSKWISMCKIHTAKNSDYSHGFDPLSNFKKSLKLNVKPSIAILIRMQDKWERIHNLIKKGSAEVKDESIEDTLLDLANYALLCLAIMDHEPDDCIDDEIDDCYIDKYFSKKV